MSDQLSFSELGLSSSTLKAIQQKGFEEPTDIQAMTIPAMLADDSHLIAQAQTGTGKTAAFGLPLIDLVNPGKKHVQALILVPTRELANQVSEEINSLHGKKKITIVPIYGGQSIDQQFRRLKKGAHIVVGTPGRIIDHLNRGTLSLDQVKYLILDEADEMLNMGFLEDVEQIMEHTDEDKKTLLFSATMPDRIKQLARKYMEDYKLLRVKKKQLTTALTRQIYFEVKASDKFEALCRIIDMESDFYSLIFCRTKIDTDDLTSRLQDRGYDAEPLHGDISQSQRERTLAKFKQQRVNILVATDVAARGIDVNNLTHVINYALPQDPESYVHRIGRTGRAGKEGTAITFITPSEYHRLMAIQRFAKTDIQKSRIPQVQEILNSKKDTVSRDILGMLEANEIDNSYFGWAKQLLEKRSPTELVAAVLNYCFEDDFDPDIYGEIREPSKRGRQVDRQGKARLFVALGKKDDITANKLIDLVTGKASLPRKAIKDVQVMDKFSFINVPFEDAEKIIHRFKVKGKRSLITLAKTKKGK